MLNVAGFIAFRICFLAHLRFPFRSANPVVSLELALKCRCVMQSEGGGWDQSEQKAACRQPMSCRRQVLVSLAVPKARGLSLKVTQEAELNSLLHVQ